jgi:hypothetical protein
MTAPSGVAVSSGIGNAGSSVQQAKKYNDLAVVKNANATTSIERIDAKAKVIQKYWPTQ